MRSLVCPSQVLLLMILNDHVGTWRRHYLLHRSEDQVKTYMRNIFFMGTPDEQLDQLLSAYPRDVTQGSPFDTGILNAISPQFKRIAAIIGDGVFQAPRRWLLQHTFGKQNIWEFGKQSWNSPNVH